MQKRLHIKIYGRVQGVGFRFSAEKKARELGLVGWARNCDDGCVETEVKGEEVAIERYLKWCQKGPMLAKVEKVEEEWGDIKEEPKNIVEKAKSENYLFDIS